MVLEVSHILVRGFDFQTWRHCYGRQLRLWYLDVSKDLCLSSVGYER